MERDPSASRDEPVVSIDNHAFETNCALQAGTISRDQFDLLAVAINTGTNIPSVATPNGQAAFLFLLTSQHLTF